jgi:hypothetical protein
MNRLNRQRPTYRISLYSNTNEQPDAWGTDFGVSVAAKINRALGGLSEGTLVAFDYGEIKRADASFQREAIVEPMRRHRPRLLFVVEGVADPDIRANLILALQQRGEVVLIRGKAGRSEAIGTITRPRLDTLAAVAGADEVTSRWLVDRLKLTGPNATNRLNDLADAGLIERVGGSATGGGRQYKYYPIR